MQTFSIETSNVTELWLTDRRKKRQHKTTTNTHTHTLTHTHTYHTQFVVLCGSLFQTVRPWYEKDSWPDDLVLTEGIWNFVRWRTNLLLSNKSLEDFSKVMRTRHQKQDSQLYHECYREESIKTVVQKADWHRVEFTGFARWFHSDIFLTVCSDTGWKEENEKCGRTSVGEKLLAVSSLSRTVQSLPLK